MLKSIQACIEREIGEASKWECIRIGKLWKRPEIQVVCRCQIKQHFQAISKKITKPVEIAHLHRYMFNRRIWVWCGKCLNCDTVYWGMVRFT